MYLTNVLQLAAARDSVRSMRGPGAAAESAKTSDQVSAKGGKETCL